ncbi:aminopeptidase M1-like isoform X1 [Coffea arabica]|uniref:Aminopeptidase n=1 Tax=Coffea arabica TaxID=13443 RepID=A0ABM4U6Z1_COFAR|nr:aminopeptidase M1-like isoform X1 [Coffea arabica]
MDSREKKLEQFKGQTRLPNFAVPKRYDLTLNLDLQVCTFSGIVLIDISIVQATKFLVLNTLDLAIDDVSFTSSENHNHIPTDIIVDNGDEILVLGFNDSLATGNGVLKICFSGTLNEQLKGLYRCTYVDGGVKKNMVATQFEAVDARLCFPCWDEPAFKATFKITLTNVPLELTALSNMPVSLEKHNGRHKTIYFEESVVMSTYLVAVVVGLFDYIEDTTDDGIKVRAYTPVGQSEKGKFALKIAVKALEFFKEYFTFPYGLPKLDMVAVPEFSGGAMENYGLIIYRENELLHDDLHSSVANTQRMTIVVAHEVAHHWFGNLVTMEWWTHLWLNEGFATWVSYLVTDILFPEWKIWNHLLQETTDGLQMDALEQSHPIEVEIHHARSVIEYFDAISYKKGSAVIRMLQDFLGNEIFQKSLSSYMARYAWGNAKTEDLWSVLSEVSGVGVSKIMSIWTKQTGYPVISLSLKDCSLEFKQTQFLSSGLHGDGRYWIIPITLSLGSYDRRTNFLLESEFGELDISDICHTGGSSNMHQKESAEDFQEEFWIKANVHQAGFYRVKYDDGLLTQLAKAIKSNCISAADEFGILDDTFALCEACEIPLSSLLSLIEVYEKDLEQITLSRLIDVCQNVAKIAHDAIPDLLATLKQFFINLLLLCAESLGWDVVPGESQLTALMREEVLMALVRFGHRETCEEALKRFQAFLDDKKTTVLPVDTRKAAYIAVMRNTSNDIRNGLEHLLRLYREVDAVQEKTRILRCLASSSDTTIVLEVLDFMFSDEVRSQDIIYVASGISLEGRSTAWTWLKERWDMILKKWGTGPLLHPLIRKIVTPFCSHEMADEIEAFFAPRVDPSFAMNVNQSLEILRIKARWVDYVKQDAVLGEVVSQLASQK